MADALKFILELVDKMSGPANAAARSIRGLDQALKSVRAVKAPDMSAMTRDLQRIPNVSKPGNSKLGDVQGPVPKLNIDTAGLDVLKQKLRDDSLAVTNLTASFRQLTAASKQDLVTLRAVEDELQKRRDSLAAVQKQLVLSGNAARYGSEGTNRLTTTLRELAEGNGNVSGKAVSDVSSMQDATRSLDATIQKLTETIDRMGQSMGEAGEKGGSNLFKGLVRGAASAVGEKLVESFGEVVADKIKGVASELQGILLTAFRENPSFRGKVAAFFTGVTALTKSKFSGLREAWAAEQKQLPGIQLGSPKQLGPQIGKGSLQHLRGPQAIIPSAPKPEKFQELSSAMGGAVKQGAQLVATFGAMAIGAAALVAALALVTVGTIALGAALVGLVGKGASLAIEANDAKGDTLDMLEAMLGSAEAANETYAAIKDLTRDTTMTITQGQELSQSLATAGLTNVSLLKDAMSSIAVVNSVIKGGGEKVQAIIEKATTAGKFDVNVKKLVGTGVQIGDLYAELNKRTGIGVKAMEKSLAAGKVSAEVGIAALTSVIENKLGNVARKQAHDFPVQMARLKESIGLLFEDVNTGPFLEAISKIVDIFDESTIAGEALHTVITDVFDGLFRAAEASIPYVKTLIKGLIIVGLTAAVAFKPLLYQLGIIGPEAEKTQPGLKLLKQTMDLIAAGAGLAAEAIVVLTDHAGMLKALGAGVALLILPFAILPALILGGVAAITYIIAKFGEFVDALGYIKDQVWQAGIGFADGLIGGIASRAQAVVDTVTGIGKKALGGFKSFFGIQSPSRVMMGVGANLSLGVAKGIPLGMPAVNDNMRRMVEIPRPQQPPEISAPRGRDGSSSRGPAKIELNFHEGAFQIQGMPGSPEFRVEVTEIFADIADELARKMGLAPTGT